MPDKPIRPLRPARLPGDSWVEWRARWRSPGYPPDVWTQSAFYSFSEMQDRICNLGSDTTIQISFRVCTVTATDWIKHE